MKLEFEITYDVREILSFDKHRLLLTPFIRQRNRIKTYFLILSTFSESCLLNQQKSDCVYYFPIDFEINGIPFEIGKW